MGVWQFIQDQVFGMKWLNELIGKGLSKLGLDVRERIGGSIQFFFYDVLKITVLLCLLIFVISYIQSYFPPERSKRILSRFHGVGANIISALLGTVTPFCSCSSIPLFIGFTSAGLPLGVTFSFLISSPMVDLGSLILLMSIFGAKVAVIYVIVGLMIAVAGGTLIEKLHMEPYVEEFVRAAGGVDIESPMKNRYSPCLCAPDFALLRFMAKPEGDERFQDHCQRKKKIQHPYYRHDRIRTDEQTGKRRKKDGHQSANIYPGIDSYQILWACVLNQQAVPCRLIDLLKAIQDCSGQKQPEIVRNSPHQTGQPPSEKIPHHGSEFSSQLVRQNAPQKGKQHLDCHRDGENQANLHICDALCVHIKSGERCDKVVRDAPQRFDQHKRTRIPPIVGQHLNERMCLQTSYF